MSDNVETVVPKDVRATLFTFMLDYVTEYRQHTGAPLVGVLTEPNLIDGKWLYATMPGPMEVLAARLVVEVPGPYHAAVSVSEGFRVEGKDPEALRARAGTLEDAWVAGDESVTRTFLGCLVTEDGVVTVAEGDAQGDPFAPDLGPLRFVRGTLGDAVAGDGPLTLAAMIDRGRRTS